MLLVKGTDLIVQCCVCREYQLVDGTFADIDESTIDDSYRVSHTYCPVCYDDVMKELEGLK